jgi:hypothetical protein
MLCGAKEASMLKIGEFSKFVQVPVPTLRYYDQVGLLKPVEVDEVTGYRYYSASQVTHLNRILALKSLGLPSMRGQGTLVVATLIDALGTGLYLPFSLLYFQRVAGLALSRSLGEASPWRRL